MQALREELDAANQKIDRYAHLVASLSEELDNLRRSICQTCKKKLIPSYAPFASESSSAGNVRRSSLWRRIVSGRHTPPLPSLSPQPVSLPNAEDSHPITSTQKRASTAIPASSESSISPRLTSMMPLDEIGSKRSNSNISYNPGIKQPLHINLVKVINFAAPVFCVKFSPNGKYLAVGLYKDSGKTFVYDVEKNSTICSFVDSHLRDQPIIWCAQFSPDNKSIATASSDGQIRVWGIRQKRMRAAFASLDSSVNTLCFSPNGHFLLSGDSGGGVRIWSLRDGSSKTLIHNAHNIFSVAFSPDGRHVASLDFHGWLRIWDARSGWLLDSWKGHTHGAFCMAFSPDGKGLVSGGEDKTLRYWDVSSLLLAGKIGRGRKISGIPGQKFQQIRTFEGHASMIRSVGFSPDHKWVVTGSLDKTLRIWDPYTATWQCTLHGDNVYTAAVDFNSAGKYLACGGNCQVSLWKFSQSCRESIDISAD